MKQLLATALVAMAALAIAGCQEKPQQPTETPPPPAFTAEPRPADELASSPTAPDRPVEIVPDVTTRRPEDTRTAPLTPPAPPPSTPASGGTYTVQKGEGLMVIARKVYGDANAARWKDIAKANDLAAPYALKEGQVLKIPK